MVLNTFTLFCNPHHQKFFTLNSTSIKKQSSLPRPQHPLTPTRLPGGMSDVLSVSCKFNHKYLSVSCFLAHEASCCSTCQESHSPWRSVTAHPQVQAIGGQSIYPLVAMWMVCPFRCCEYRGEHVVQRSVHIPTFNSCGYISGIAGVDGDSVFGFLRNYHTFSPQWLHHLTLPPVMWKDSRSSRFGPMHHTPLFVSPCLRLSWWIWWVSYPRAICISLKVSDVEHPSCA